MAHLFVVFVAALAAVAGLPAAPEMPDPGSLALLLSEDDFDDYLDEWLEAEQKKWLNMNTTRDNGRVGLRSGCQFSVNGDLSEPQPVYLYDGDYLTPSGNTGVIHLSTGHQVTMACTAPGSTINHAQITSSPSIATATCVSGNQVSGTGWLNGEGAFGRISCSSHPYYEAEYTGDRCWGNNRVIRVGFIVSGVFYPKYWSCFDTSRLEVLYTWYEQNPHNSITQTGVNRPNWLAGSFFPGVPINNLYTQVTQKEKIATYVGNALADKYVTSTQYLSRGHLCAKTDMVFANGQRSTFYFINSAPQWQAFNAGNWNSIEQNLRTRIAQAGFYTTIYTGTFGVSQLRNQNNQLVDIYLYHDDNNNPQLPIPLYFYKVVYDAARRQGTAFVSINNPYYTEAEVRALTFCTDRCRNNPAFNWLNWQPDRIDIGYSFCCTLDDFRRVVPHLPAFHVNGLFS